MLSQSSNESMCYETILTLSGENYSAAYEIYEELKRRVDPSEILPTFSSELSRIMGLWQDDIESVWRRVRDSYSRIRASYEIIDEKHHFFPKELLKSEYPSPFLYALGNIRLLEKDMLTVLGSLSPTEQGIKIASEVSDYIAGNNIALFTPLRIGLSSIAIADTLKKSSNVIAFSSSFVTKAPNERLRDQMLDIYKRGGLIISACGPAIRENKWHQVIRNRAISALSDSIFLIEEKDGGPSWKIYDEAHNAKKMLSFHTLDLEGYQFTRNRISEGALIYKEEKDLKKLLVKKEKRERIRTDLSLTPDLF